MIAALLGYGKFLVEAAVALALTVGGVSLLGVVLYDFVRDLGQAPFLSKALELLSGLLLVFIFTELISTIRVVIARRSVEVEPFLIVGIVAAIRRIIVVSAEAENLFGTARFRDLVGASELDRPPPCPHRGAIAAAALTCAGSTFVLPAQGASVHPPAASHYLARRLVLWESPFPAWPHPPGSFPVTTHHGCWRRSGAVAARRQLGTPDGVAQPWELPDWAVPAVVPTIVDHFPRRGSGERDGRERI